jgi:hypothetical protein
MAGTPGHVGNPLTLIAIFAGLSEAVSAAALPFLEAAAQDRLVWFVTLFPCGLVVLFFVTLWVWPGKLYGPGDYKTDEAFLSTISKGVYASTGDAAQKLRAYWKPGGVVNEVHAKALQAWLLSNNAGTDSIAEFLASAEYKDQRDRAVAHFGL